MGAQLYCTARLFTLDILINIFFFLKTKPEWVKSDHNNNNNIHYI